MDGTLVVYYSNIIRWNAYRISNDGDSYKIEKYCWFKCTYVPASEDAKSRVKNDIVQFYCDKIRKSGLKNLEEIHKKTSFKANNPLYKYVVDDLKRDEWLPCTEEEYHALHPLPRDLLRDLTLVHYSDNTSEEEIKQDLYTAFKYRMNSKSGVKHYVEMELKENPVIKKYTEYKKIIKGEYTPTLVLKEMMHEGM